MEGVADIVKLATRQNAHPRMVSARMPQAVSTATCSICWSPVSRPPLHRASSTTPRSRPTGPNASVAVPGDCDSCSYCRDVLARVLATIPN
jgi:hypothetical protein